MAAITPAEALELLEERARRARARRETERQACLEALLAAAAPLRGRGGRAWLIGSVVWGGFFPGSDIDVVVDGLTPAQARALERSFSLAARRPVDVLELGALPASFQARVAAEGVAIL